MGEEEKQVLSEKTGVYDLPVSKRLQNILARSGILTLSDLKEHCVESLIKMRNMGEGTCEELERVCKQCNVHLHSKRDLDDPERGILFKQEQYLALFKKGIRCKEDVFDRSEEELAALAGGRNAVYQKLIKIKS